MRHEPSRQLEQRRHARRVVVGRRKHRSVVGLALAIVVGRHDDVPGLERLATAHHADHVGARTGAHANRLRHVVEHRYQTDGLEFLLQESRSGLQPGRRSFTTLPLRVDQGVHIVSQPLDASLVAIVFGGKRNVGQDTQTGQPHRNSHSCAGVHG